jgi:hypothetical protein
METMNDRPATLHDTFEALLPAVRDACLGLYGGRLLAQAVFGSVAWGTQGPDSDIDLLLVADPLPHGRMARVGDWRSFAAPLLFLGSGGPPPRRLPQAAGLPTMGAP